jgi:two-component system chemotaxis sensor kinase CheA
MNDNLSSELSPELLSEFYSECDEHLKSVRRSLTILESHPQPAEIESVFRSFHSLKGIIAMAGISSAEQVAHRTEDFLRDVSAGRVQLSAQGVDLIARSAQMIEATVAAFRDKQALPDATPLLASFDAMVGATSAESEHKPSAKPVNQAESSLQQKLAEVAKHGRQIWKFTFTASTTLNERGVNVNTTRERLSRIGEIVQATPRIGGGTIAFEFLVAVQDPPSDKAEWAKDGVTLELFDGKAVGISGREKAAPLPPSQSIAPSQLVRVSLDRLDDLMRVTGELVIQRARLEEQIDRLAAQGVDTRGLHEVNVGFGRQFRELRETVIRLRMIPVSEIFSRMSFVVRDLTRNTNKKVHVDIQGQQTEMDKYVVEQLKDPLLHMVRNAVSHGIEDSQERVARGKSAEAVLKLSAHTAGETVIIEISDDGRGVDREKIFDRARQLEVALSEDADNASLLDIICLPGFSTREEADRASGRGVGMTVVSNTLRELGGTMSLDFKQGVGTKFTLRLPLTLLITEALIVSSGGQNYAIPQSSVDEVLHIEEANVKQMERAELVSVRGAALPLIRLRGLFGFPKSDKKMPSVLISRTDRGRVGLVVDRILGQRQVVVRSLRDPLIHVPGVIGATELGDGRPLLILDPHVLTRQSSNTRADAQLAAIGN